MLRFRVIVPVEHEIELIDALIDFGLVHLDPRSKRAELKIPPLLQSIIERRINYKELNINEAVKIAWKIMGSTELALQIERLARQYHDFVGLRDMIRKMEEKGLSSLVTLKETLPLLEAFSIHIEDFKIPSWAYRSVEDLKKFLEKKIENTRKEIYDLIIELAEIVEAAIMYEHATRFELLEELEKRCEFIRKNIPKIEYLFSELLNIELFNEVVDKCNVNLLVKLGLTDTRVYNISDEERWNKSEFLKLMKDIGSTHSLLKLSEELANKVEILLAEKYAIKKLLSHGIWYELTLQPKSYLILYGNIDKTEDVKNGYLIILKINILS
ncbi:MAG: hypothetical protein DRJ41_04550 [Thermoprotei archaeon]|nr:MAG: hypothetical protein DRJ41_04550 [Thermoprotei archaeon]